MTGVARPTAPGRCGSALQEFRFLGSVCLLGRIPRPPSWWAHAWQELHCPPPPGGVAVDNKSSTAHCPQAERGSVLHEFQCPLPQGIEVVHDGSCKAHSPRAVWQCVVGVPLPTAPRRCGSALQEFHCPVPPGSEAAYCGSCTAQCPPAMRQCIAGVALRNAPKQ